MLFSSLKKDKKKEGFLMGLMGGFAKIFENLGSWFMGMKDMFTTKVSNETFKTYSKAKELDKNEKDILAKEMEAAEKIKNPIYRNIAIDVVNLKLAKQLRGKSHRLEADKILNDVLAKQKIFSLKKKDGKYVEAEDGKYVNEQEIKSLVDSINGESGISATFNKLIDSVNKNMDSKATKVKMFNSDRAKNLIDKLNSFWGNLIKHENSGLLDEEKTNKYKAQRGEVLRKVLTLKKNIMYIKQGFDVEVLKLGNQIKSLNTIHEKLSKNIQDIKDKISSLNPAYTVAKDNLNRKLKIEEQKLFFNKTSIANVQEKMSEISNNINNIIFNSVNKAQVEKIIADEKESFETQHKKEFNIFAGKLKNIKEEYSNLKNNWDAALDWSKHYKLNDEEFKKNSPNLFAKRSYIETYKNKIAKIELDLKDDGAIKLSKDDKYAKTKAYVEKAGSELEEMRRMVNDVNLFVQKDKKEDNKPSNDNSPGDGDGGGSVSLESQNLNQNQVQNQVQNQHNLNQILMQAMQQQNQNQLHKKSTKFKK